MVSQLHFLLLLDFPADQEQSILNHYLLDVFVDWTQLLLGLLRILGAGFMLDVEGRVVVGFEQPRIEVLVDQDIDTDHMEALPVVLGES